MEYTPQRPGAYSVRGATNGYSSAQSDQDVEWLEGVLVPVSRTPNQPPSPSNSMHSSLSNSNSDSAEYGVISEETYTVPWSRGRLGLLFGRHRSLKFPVVKRLTGGAPEIASTVSIGDALVSIEGLDTTVLGYEETLRALPLLPKPAQLCFRRAVTTADRETTSSGHSGASRRTSSALSGSSPELGPAEYSVMWMTDAKLGIHFIKGDTGEPVVTRVSVEAGHPGLEYVQPGDILFEVGTEATVDIGYKQSIFYMTIIQKPCVLKFRKPPSSLNPPRSFSSTSLPPPPPPAASSWAGARSPYEENERRLMRQDYEERYTRPAASAVYHRDREEREAFGASFRSADGYVGGDRFSRSSDGYGGAERDRYSGGPRGRERWSGGLDNRNATDYEWQQRQRPPPPEYYEGRSMGRYDGGNYTSSYSESNSQSRGDERERWRDRQNYSEQGRMGYREDDGAAYDTYGPRGVGGTLGEPNGRPPRPPQGTGPPSHETYGQRPIGRDSGTQSSGSASGRSAPPSDYPSPESGGHGMGRAGTWSAAMASGSSVGPLRAGSGPSAAAPPTAAASEPPQLEFEDPDEVDLDEVTGANFDDGKSVYEVRTVGYVKENELQKNEQYRFMWNGGPLNFELSAATSVSLVINAVDDSAEFLGFNLGDHLIGINGKRVADLGAEEALKLLETSPKPVILDFQAAGKGVTGVESRSEGPEGLERTDERESSKTNDASEPGPGLREEEEEEYEV